jgi:hypothetical protein
VQLPPGCVACPICGLSVREAFINSHVDTCLTRGGGGQQQRTPGQSPPPTAAADSGPAGAHGNSLKQQQQQQQKPAAAGRPPQQAVAGPNAAAASLGSARSGAVAALAGPARASSGSSSSRGRRGAVLEAPPKLCFELLKERDLKAKLASLGLSNEGSKKVRQALRSCYAAAACCAGHTAWCRYRSM